MFKGKKWIQIQYSSKGAFFRFANRRYYLHNCLRANSEYFDGYISIGGYNGLLIKLNPTGECLKALYE